MSSTRDHPLTQIVFSIGGVDRHAFTWVVDHRTSVLNPIFEGLTYLGTGGTLWVLLALLLAWRTHRPVVTTTIFVAATVWGADAAASILKLLIGRPRPFVADHHLHLLVGQPSSAALPSGHATTACAGAVLLGWLWPRGAWAFALLALGIAYSRIYVGVHYPSDVLAGAALGAACALAAITVARRSRRIGGRLTPGRVRR
jgi:undecaprenyl-diphosphatase